MADVKKWTGFVRVVAVESRPDCTALGVKRDLYGNLLVCEPLFDGEGSVGGALLHLACEDARVIVGDCLTVTVTASGAEGTVLRKRIVRLQRMVRDLERETSSEWAAHAEGKAMTEWHAESYTGRRDVDVPMPSADEVRARIAELELRLTALEACA